MPSGQGDWLPHSLVQYPCVVRFSQKSPGAQSVSNLQSAPTRPPGCTHQPCAQPPPSQQTLAPGHWESALHSAEHRGVSVTPWQKAPVTHGLSASHRSPGSCPGPPVSTPPSWTRHSDGHQEIKPSGHLPPDSGTLPTLGPSSVVYGSAVSNNSVSSGTISHPRSPGTFHNSQAR